MFIHLGADKLVSSKDVIMIINAENGVKAASTIEFLKNSSREGKEDRIEAENCKSIVVTDSQLYYSPISSQTLKKRAGFTQELGET